MEIRIQGDRITVSGYVNAVERDSRLLPPSMAEGATEPFIERVAAGTFARALAQGRPVRLMYNHARGLGSTATGELTLQEDAVGLRPTAVVEDAEVARHARRGELTGWSFGFHADRAEWSRGEGDEHPRRTITAMTLDEVSILTVTPAYIATTVEMRGEDVSVREIRSIEDAATIADTYHDTLRAHIDLARLR